MTLGAKVIAHRGSSPRTSGVARLHSTSTVPTRMVPDVGVHQAHSANHVLRCDDAGGVRRVFRRRRRSGLAWSSMIRPCPPRACDLVRVSLSITFRTEQGAGS